jgi:hypothetical protein
MPVYLYQGQHYTIATDDPAEAKRKIMASLPPEKSAMDYARDFGKSAASLADTVLGAPAAVGQQIGYGVGRAFGLSPEEATASSMRTTQPFMTPVGSALGITQDPAYQNEATKQIARGIESTVVKPVAQYTGLPEQDVGSMVNTGMMGLAPVAGRVGSAVGRGVYNAGDAAVAGAQAVGSGLRTAAMAPVQAAKGAFNAATGGESALVPLGKTYITPEGAQLLREGRIDVATAESPQYTRPISELPSNAIERGALKIAGQQMPVAGKGAQAFGERVMSDYIANPYKAAVDIGIPLVTGVPFSPYSIGRGMQAGADYLLSRKGFDPGLQQQVAQAKTQQAFQPPQVPQLTYNPSPGPVEPSTIYATPGGQAGTNLPQVGQAALGEKYPPPAPVSPAEVSQQAAAARIQPAAPAMSAEQQALIDQVRARTAAKTEAERVARVTALQQRAQAAGGYTPPVAEAPAPAPAPTNSLEALRSRLTPQTPEQLAAVEAYNALSPADKAAQTRAQKKAPPGVSQMLTDDAAGGTWDNPLPHEAALKQISFNNLSNKPNMIVGQSADGTIKYTVRDISRGAGRLNRTYDVIDPATGKEVYSVEYNKFANKNEQTLVKDSTGFDYTFDDGKLVKIVNAEGRVYHSSDADWKSLPKITEPKVIDLISQIPK